MGTSTLRRVEVQVTGVAGSPYYIVGYFTADSGTTNQCITAWMTFVAGVTSGSSIAWPSGALITAQDVVQLVDPATGQPVGTEVGTALSVTGTGTGQMMSPATQILTEWHTNNYLNGREVRGRTNHPCVRAADATTSGAPSGATISGWNSAASALIGDANTVFVIWSKKNGQWFAAESGSTWNKFSVLRSRRD